MICLLWLNKIKDPLCFLSLFWFGSHVSCLSLAVSQAGRGRSPTSTELQAVPPATDSKQTGKRPCEYHPAMHDRLQPQASVHVSGQHVRH